MCSHDSDVPIHENSNSQNKAEWLGPNHYAVYEAIGSDKTLITIRLNNKHNAKAYSNDFFILSCMNYVLTLHYWLIIHAPLFLEKSATVNCVLSVAFYYKNHAHKDLETHSYNQTFALYRHKVSNPTIKRFYSFDQTFPFLYWKHSVQKWTCVVTTQNHLEILSILRFIVITPINDVANT